MSACGGTLVVMGASSLRAEHQIIGGARLLLGRRQGLRVKAERSSPPSWSVLTSPRCDAAASELVSALETQERLRGPPSCGEVLTAPKSPER